MTTQTSFSDKKAVSPNRRFFNSRYFRFQLKTGWPLLVVFIFVFVLSTAVPTVSFISDELRRLGNQYVSYNDIKNNAVDFLHILGAINVVISMFGGLLCGLTAMRFTNNKVAVNFYHSLPMRRESIFVTSTLQNFAYYAAAFAAGLLFTFAALSIRLGGAPMYIRPILLTFEYGVLFFFLVYAMTLFAASLTGTGFMRFVGAAYVVFLPLAMFVLFVVTVGTCGVHSSILNIEYYLSSEFCITLCAPLRFINFVGTDSLGNTVFTGFISKDIVIVFVTALVYYGLAFLLYCVRHSESASHPIIWKPARFVFKYSSMFMGGTVFALLFYGMFESIAWMVFGIIIGTVIVFMFANGIINKSARAIFKGLRGLGVYMAVMAVITVVFYCDVLGMFATVPDGSLVRRAEVTLDYTASAEYRGDFASKVTDLIRKTYENDVHPVYGYDGGIYTESDDKPLVEIYTEDEAANDKIVNNYAYAGYEYQSMPLEAVLHTKIGIPYAIRFYPNCEAAYELAKYMYNTGKVETEIPEASEIESGYIEVYLNEYSEYVEYVEYAADGTYFRKGANSTELVRLAAMLSDPFGLEAASPIVGQITLYVKTDDYNVLYLGIGRYRNFLIHANDTEVLNELISNKEVQFEDEDDVIEYYIDANPFDGVHVVDNDEHERITVTDRDTMRELVRSLWSINRYYENAALCERDHSYNVFLRTNDNTEYYYNCLHFRKGEVPETVRSLFGE